MKKLALVLVLGCMMISGCGQSTTPGQLVETIRNDVSNYDRISNIIDEAYEDNKGTNVIISPLSLNTSLGLVSEGAKGDTKTELLNFLGSNDYTSEISSYINSIDNKEGLLLASSIWVNNNHKLVESYRSLAKSTYNADINSVSFETAYLDNTVKDINNWCKEKTNGLTPVIISRDDLSKETASVIVNSLYFKSEWASVFDVKQSKFKDINNKEILVDTISGKAKFYYENEYAKGFSVDYKNGIKFIGMLPNEEKEFTITDLDIDSFLEYKTDAYDVLVSIPKFDIDFTTTNTVNALKHNDVTTMFDPTRSNLSGMIKTDNGETLYVSDIIQRCRVSLDEFGTEAAASTAIIVDKNGFTPESNRKTKKIDLNRPFVFMIYDEHAEQILFIGKVVTIN